MVSAVNSNASGITLVVDSSKDDSQSSRVGEQATTATGNLVQDRDEYLASTGSDTDLVRTYNAQGLFANDNGDSGLNAAALINLPALPDTMDSTITKRFSDGVQRLYTFKPGRGVYVSTDAAGANEMLIYHATTGLWSWTDRENRKAEFFNTAGQLVDIRDANGVFVVTYTGAY